MKLRVSGTRAECDAFVAALRAATAPGVIREVSGFYANRGDSLLGRVYLELALPPQASAPGPGTEPGDAERLSSAAGRRGRRTR